MITLSVPTFNAISEVMEDSGYTIESSEKIDTHWGKIKARLKKFKNSDGEICTLLGLPHLSMYKLFSAKSEHTKRAVENILDKAVADFCE